MIRDLKDGLKDIEIPCGISALYLYGSFITGERILWEVFEIERPESE